MPPASLERLTVSILSVAGTVADAVRLGNSARAI